MTVETFGGRQKVEVVIAEPYAYLNLPDQGWLRLGGERRELALALQIGSTGFFDTFPANVVPWELYTVRSLGREVVEGVETDHLSVQLDIGEVIRRSDAGVRQRLVRNLAPPGLAGRTRDPEELAGEMEVRGVEV